MFYYHQIILHPSKFILNDTGDAIKNYFCYNWHIFHDTSINDYSGSNYPYGELHSFTDGNPLLSNFIRYIPFLKNYSIPIFNLSIFISYLLCAWLLLKIFIFFKVPDFASFIAAPGITLLCPQILRIGGHLTLAYSFAIPLVIYLILKFSVSDSKSKLNWLICLTLILYFFIHPYLGMICSGLLFFYWTANLLIGKNSVKQALFFLFIQSLVPLLFYFVYLKLIDNHPDRSETPYGFLYFVAKIETVFISTMPPFRHMLSLIYKIRGQNWEGIAYVGITSLFSILFAIVMIIIKRKKIKDFLSQNPKYSHLISLIISSVILLFFSMGIPFIWNMEWLLDYLPALKQFRAPGRFAWVFFFVATIFSTIVLSKHILTRQKRIIQTVTYSALLFLFTIEAIPFHNALSKSLFVPNCFNRKYVEWELNDIIKNIGMQNAQAIIPLPFYHIGSDFYYIEGTQKIKRASFIAAFHTGIPLVSSLTPRTSISESTKVIQMLSSELYDKSIEQIIPKEKYFILLIGKETLNDDEKELSLKGELLCETKNYYLRKISGAELLSNFKKEKIQDYSRQMDTLFKNEGLLSTNKSFTKFISYDSNENGVLKAFTNEMNTIYKIAPQSLEKDKEYEVSLWYNFDQVGSLFNILKIQNKVGDSLHTVTSRNICSMPNTNGKTTIARLSFIAEHPENEYWIALQSSDKTAKHVYTIDNFLIRRKDNCIYRSDVNDKTKTATLYLNNFLLN